MMIISLCIVIIGVGVYFFSDYINNDGTSSSSMFADNIEVKSKDLESEYNKNLDITSKDVDGEYNDNLGKKIYCEVNTQFSLMYDPSVTENLLRDNGVVVKLKVLSVGRTRYLLNDDGDFPATPYTVEILDVISDNDNAQEINKSLKKDNQFTVYFAGGAVSAKEMIDHCNERGRYTATKMGLNNLSLEEQKEYYVLYKGELYYELTPGEEYLVVLGQPTRAGEYFVKFGGYSVFERKGDQLSYKNVITEKTLELKD